MSPNKNLVLALNAGSSSLKASVIQEEHTLISFLAERLSTKDATITVRDNGNSKLVLENERGRTCDHAEALSRILSHLEEAGKLSDLAAVGHRVVHEGSIFSDSVLVDDSVLEKIKSVSHLAPLHNPHNVAGIEVMRKLLPNIPNAAVFDTSFHSSIPAKAYTYPLPSEYRKKDMRKFGFHGTSVKFVSQKATKIMHRLATKVDETNGSRPFQMMVCHLGNGASVTAVSGDKSMDSSMGFTPLSGIIMGTRCGDVDPSLVSFAVHQLDKDVDEVLNDFNKKSGLKSMTPDGENDMRVLLSRAKEGNKEAQLAVDMFVYHLAQNIAHYMIALEGPLDAMVFTAGIGEHSSEIRRQTIEQLRKILPALTLDAERNEVDGSDTDGLISEEGQWPVILVIPTDEEAMIANECIRLVQIQRSESLRLQGYSQA